mmetsp:Transcript_8627/g.9487  ORF Transcript_8627/g.9487 Transcript_8627/m.9487 type:complete len:462 (+) Transcript_8627:162-1547(+)
MLNLNNTHNKITSNQSASIVCTLAVAAAGGLFLWQKKKKKKIAVGNKTVSIDLLDFESKLYNLDTSPVASLTWFKGDFSVVKPKLEKRLMLIVEKNPWLQGRIVFSNCFKGTYKLSYCERSTGSSVNIDENLEFVPPEDSPLSRDTSFEELGVVMGDAGLIIKNGRYQPLFKVHIIPCSKNPHERFALVVQMSHMAGDGATYYKLLDMICSIGEDCIERLEPVRIMRTDEMQNAVMGGKESGELFTSPGVILRLVWGIIAEKLRGRKTYPRFRFLDPAKMQSLKDVSMKEKGMASDVQFVSTNDVITSWFMSRIRCEPGFMAINWRNRLEGHTDLHAGNYEKVIFYQKEDYASPALIRKSVMEYKRAVTKDVPGFWKMVTSKKCLAVVTNWASFAKSNEIEGCEEEIHLPLLTDPSFCLNLYFLIIFRAGAGRVGLCYFGNTPDGTNPLDDAPFTTIKDTD